MPAALAQLPPPQPGVIERVAPAAPPRLGPALRPPAPTRATGPGEERRVALGAVRFEGSTALPAGILLRDAPALDARAVTLADIETARLAVLGAYRAAGLPYVAVAALLAPRADHRADLVLRVTEGSIAEIAIEGTIGPAEAQLRRFLAPLVGQRPILAAALERALLLAGDIPGVAARGVLRPIPGEPGALQLLVQVARRPVGGFVNLDNRGQTMTGAWQGLLVGQLNAFTGLGERTEFALLETDGHGQSFAQLSEEVFLGGSGLRLRLHAGAGRAEPGSPLATIGYAGETRVAGAMLSYPIIRARPLNLTVTGGLDAFESVVEASTSPGAPPTRQSRDAVRALRLGLDGAMIDAWVGLAPAAATSTGLLRFSQGIEALGATQSGGARPGSDVGFTKLVAEATRLQPLFEPVEGWLVSVLGQVAAQWSDDILPPAERYYLGGNRLGRGFYAGQVAGDRALAGSAEIQAGRVFDLPGLRLGTQFYAFRDEARGWDNGPGSVRRSLASWGGGVRLQFDERVQLDLEGVRRLTRQPEGENVTPLRETAVFARVLVRF